jgi:hypothetical protein
MDQAGLQLRRPPKRVLRQFSWSRLRSAPSHRACRLRVLRRIARPAGAVVAPAAAREAPKRLRTHQSTPSAGRLAAGRLAQEFTPATRCPAGAPTRLGAHQSTPSAGRLAEGRLAQEFTPATRCPAPGAPINSVRRTVGRRPISAGVYSGAHTARDAPINSVRRTVGRRPISAGVYSGAPPRSGRTNQLRPQDGWPKAD